MEDSHYQIQNLLTVIKIARYWQKDRHTHQWNKLDSPETEPHKYGQLIFDKSAMATEKGQSF